MKVAIIVDAYIDESDLVCVKKNGEDITESFHPKELIEIDEQIRERYAKDPMTMAKNYEELQMSNEERPA